MMAGWTTHTGRALALAIDNIDTDQLIPARFMSIPRSEGYGHYLLHDMRRDINERLLSDFPLNCHDGCSILIVGRNFGSGSSREAAVYALIDAGVRVVIAPSFGDIFSNNAVNNGLLPARVSPEVAGKLTHMLGKSAGEMSIDLGNCTLTFDDFTAAFELDESWRVKLVNGWDDIDLTRQHLPTITRFREIRSQESPWAWPAAAD